MSKVPNDWTIYEAAHLLNRAGFGGTPKELRAFHKRGRHGAVEWLLEGEESNAPVAPVWVNLGRDSRKELIERRKEFLGLSAEERAKKRQKIQMRMQRERRKDGLTLLGWWVERMRTTDAPLQEKMTLFWHDHFPSSAQKVRRPRLMHQQNELFRKEALGNFGRLTKGVVTDPAMMLYLDLAQSSKKKPNENFARELMELFTLGEGNYSEKDIKEVARAMTGYQVNRQSGKVVFNQRRWDEGEKVILGKKGNFDTLEVVDLLLGKPECGRYLASKIWEFFAYDNPERELVSRMGDRFFQAGYELKILLRAIFLSAEFYSPRAMNSQIKSPLEFVVMMNRQLELGRFRDGILSAILEQLGQVPFLPPNVAGWDWGKAWVNTNTLLTRYHFAGLVTGAGGELKMTNAGKSGQNRRAKAFLARALQRGLPKPDYEALVPLEDRKDAAQLVAQLSFRLFQAPLSEKNQIAFEGYAKAKGSAVFTDADVAEIAHLMMSTPSYQLT